LNSSASKPRLPPLPSAVAILTVGIGPGGGARNLLNPDDDIEPPGIRLAEVEGGATGSRVTPDRLATPPPVRFKQLETLTKLEG
jgi:hypothetical protein